MHFYHITILGYRRIITMQHEYVSITKCVVMNLKTYKNSKAPYHYEKPSIEEKNYDPFVCTKNWFVATI